MDIQKEEQPSLPLEIAENILCQLPIKSILRFRCVSKAWNGLINDPLFIEKQLNCSTSFGIIIRSNGLYVSSHSFHPGQTIKSDQFRVVQRGYRRLYTLTQPSDQLNDGPEAVLGSCDGLLLLGSLPMQRYDRWGCSRELPMVLYNPSTRKYRELPTPALPFSYNSSCCIRCGLGYNATFTKDYQVISVSVVDYLCSFETVLKCEIYSLRNNTWRETVLPAAINPWCFTASMGVTVCGVVHWATPHAIYKEGPRYIIIVFNFGNDEFSEMLLPDLKINDPYDSYIPKVVLLGGCLCCIYEDTSRRHFEGYECWMMKDYGVKESWIKLFKIKDYIPLYKGDQPRLYDALNLFVQGGHLYLYKPEEKRVVGLQPPCSGVMSFAATFVESLVDIPTLPGCHGICSDLHG